MHALLSSPPYPLPVVTPYRLANVGSTWQMPPRPAFMPAPSPKRERIPTHWSPVKAARGNATHPGEASRSRGGGGYDSEEDLYGGGYGRDNRSREHDGRSRSRDGRGYGGYGNKENLPSPNPYCYERGRYDRWQGPPMGNHVYRRTLQPADERPVYPRYRPP